MTALVLFRLALELACLMPEQPVIAAQIFAGVTFLFAVPQVFPSYYQWKAGQIPNTDISSLLWKDAGEPRRITAGMTIFNATRTSSALVATSLSTTSPVSMSSDAATAVYHVYDTAKSVVLSAEEIIAIAAPATFDIKSAPGRVVLPPSSAAAT